MKNQILVLKSSSKKQKVSGKAKRLEKSILNKRAIKAYWLWFEFSKKDTKKLQKIKNIINKKLKGPRFDIHLTLIGPYLKLKQNDLESIKKISKKIKKFKIELIKYELTNEKYTSFYIKVKNSKRLNLARERFFNTNYVNQYLKFNPHISLYYGEKDTKTKKNIISKLPKINKSVTINTLSICDVNEKINKWKIIKRIKLNE